jgi:cholesterol transport system auxiliary component
MTMMKHACLVLLAGLAGCALTAKSAPPPVRYFAPPGAPGPTISTTPSAAGGRLRLGRITASAHLRYRIVERTSAVELHAYDSLRWTDYPETYVRRAVAHALFDVRGVAQAVGGAGPTLDLEVVGFEQCRSPAGRYGRVELRYLVRDERTALAVGTIEIERPATAIGIDGVVDAIGHALDDAAAELAERIVPVLR